MRAMTETSPESIAPGIPKTDEYGEVVNDPATYEAVAAELVDNGSVLIGWTDGEYTHYDLLFVHRPFKFGNIQRGLHRSRNLLFVSVIGRGTFGFDLDPSNDLHPGYVGEKLGLGENVTTVALTEFLTEIIDRLAG